MYNMYIYTYIHAYLDLLDLTIASLSLGIRDHTYIKLGYTYAI